MTDKTTTTTKDNSTTQAPTDTTSGAQAAPHAVPVTTKPRRIRKPVQAASTVQDRPSYANLSFVKGRMGQHGFSPSSFFAVPDEEWYAGRITGVLAFQELQRWMQAEGFGSCSSNLECEAVCPKQISADWISWMHNEAQM